MTRLRQKYKNLKKRLEQPVKVKVVRVGMPNVLTLEHDQMFSRYQCDFINAHADIQRILIENVARGLCKKMLEDGLIEIETAEDPYGMIVVKCRLRVVTPS